ncbi:N-acetylgalactosamine-6-sulfatase [Labilibacter sediminis]|nr:N-acetylgalactosamine-6-sulfatase [Labilibacter sediminis]
MTKLNFILTALLICIAISTQAGNKKKPNVILIMADDLGYGDVGFNGNTVIKTPNMDAMAQSGVKFTNFYSGGPVCSPTRGTCVTGRHYFRYGIFSANIGHLPKQEVTLAQLLKENGYTTGHFGKWHMGTLSKEISPKGPKRKPAKNFSPPWEHNYDVSFVTESAVATWNPSVGGRYNNNPYYFNGVEETENLDGDDSRVIMDRVVPFVNYAVKNDMPFLSVIWFHTPHEPVIAGPEYKKMYAEYSEGKQDYYGCITAMDDQIGRLQAELKRLQVDDNTIIFFCSDNGPEGKEVSDKRPGTTGGLRGRKRSLYCGGVGVPAYVVWPGKTKAGTTTDYISSTLDYLPSIIDGLGMKMPDERPLDGVSLLPMLAGIEDDRTNPLPFMHRGNVAWITGDLKFMTGGKKVKEVYNLREDRFETTNIKDQLPEEVKAMEKYIMEWNLSCKNSHSGGDYKGEFVPVDRWSGIDVKKEPDQKGKKKNKEKKNKEK